MGCSKLQCIVASCSALWQVAVRCAKLQCVVASCSALWQVVVGCGKLQCVVVRGCMLSVADSRHWWVNFFLLYIIIVPLLCADVDWCCWMLHVASCQHLVTC